MAATKKRPRAAHALQTSAGSRKTERWWHRSSRGSRASPNLLNRVLSGGPAHHSRTGTTHDSGATFLSLYNSSLRRKMKRGSPGNGGQDIGGKGCGEGWVWPRDDGRSRGQGESGNRFGGRGSEGINRRQSSEKCGEETGRNNSQEESCRDAVGKEVCRKEVPCKEVCGEEAPGKEVSGEEVYRKAGCEEEAGKQARKEAHPITPIKRDAAP